MNKLISIFLLVSFAGFSTTREAREFSCQSGDELFKLRLNAETNAVERVMFFDGHYSFTPTSAHAEELSYQINVQGHSTALNKEAREGVIKFFLPKSRPVTLRQVGGYYHPIYQTIAFTFSLKIDLVTKDSLSSHILSCQGL